MPEQPASKKRPRPAAVRRPSAHGPGYAELHCKTNFSFLEGASHPDELAQRAAELGLAALAVTDRNTLAGVVRAHAAAKDLNLKLVVGAEIELVDAPGVVLWTTDRASYGRLAHLITRGRRQAPKGAFHLSFADLAEHAEGLMCGIRLWAVGCRLKEEEEEEEEERPQRARRTRRGVTHGGRAPGVSPGTAGRSQLLPFQQPKPPDSLRLRQPKPSAAAGQSGPGAHAPGSPVEVLSSSLRPPACSLQPFRDLFGDRCYLLGELVKGPDDEERLAAWMELARQAGLPLVAAGDVHYHARGAAGLAGRADGDSPGHHGRGGGRTPVCQCRAVLEIGRGNGRALCRARRGAGAHAGNRRAFDVFARRTALRLSGRAFAAGRNAAGVSHAAGLARARPSAIRPACPKKSASWSSTSCG